MQRVTQTRCCCLLLAAAAACCLLLLLLAACCLLLLLLAPANTAPSLWDCASESLRPSASATRSSLILAWVTCDV